MSFTPQKFAVIGAGPVGNIVAAYLAKGGYEVTLCDLSMANLEVALDPGILVEGTDSLQTKVARITTRIEDLAHNPPDVVIVAVKATALAVVGRSLRALFAHDGRGPYVISWQNGIDTERVLANWVGARHVMRGVINFGCVPLAPGHVKIAFHHRPHHIQALDPLSQEASQVICRVFTECGLDTDHTDAIRDVVWRKAILNGSMNPVCAVTGKTMAEVVHDPVLFLLVGALIKEGIAVAQAHGLELGPGFYAYCINYLETAGHHKPSMLQDLEVGAKTEIDFINGKIVEYGTWVKVATPCHTMLQGMVKALESEAKPQRLTPMDLRHMVETVSNADPRAGVPLPYALNGASATI